MLSAGSAQPASPTILAGTPATVLLFGTGCSTTEPAAIPGAMADLDVTEDFSTCADQARHGGFSDGDRPFPCRCRPGDILEHGGRRLR